MLRFAAPMCVFFAFLGISPCVHGLEPVTMLIDSSSRGYHVEDAIARMQDGTPLNIVIFGQSVSERIRPDSLAARLTRMYPSATVTVRNISKGACSASSTLCDNSCICSELKNSPDKLAAFREADLVVQHVYGWEGGFITLYNFFQQNLKPGAELAIWNDHAPIGDTTADHSKAYNRYIGRYFKREQCAARDWAFIDVMTPWYGYLTQQGIGPGGLLIDAVHPNADGSELLEALLASYFVSPSEDNTAPRLTGAHAGSATRFVLSFSEELDPVSAQTAANYSVSGGITVTGAALLPFGSGVVLTTTPAPAGSHTITVSNVADRSPNANIVDAGASSVSVAVAETYGWNSVDIGTCSAPGDAVWDGSSCTIASSADATNDYKHECHYTFVPSYGDCRIVARLAEQQQFLSDGKTITNTMAGVAIRETHHYYSRFAIAGVHAGGEAGFYYRDGTSGKVRRKTTGTSGLTTPVWLEMTRTGNTIEASVSSDGSAWTSLGTVSLAMGHETTIGLFAIGGKYDLTNTARFADVTVQSGQTPVLQSLDGRHDTDHTAAQVRARGGMIQIDIRAQSAVRVDAFALDGALLGRWRCKPSDGLLNLPMHHAGPLLVRVEADGTRSMHLVVRK